MPFAARAQQPARVYRLGFLTPTSGPTANHQALDDALTQLGYREGRNLVTERRYAAGNDRLPVLAADLVRANVDVIVTESAAGPAPGPVKLAGHGNVAYGTLRRWIGVSFREVLVPS